MKQELSAILDKCYSLINEKQYSTVGEKLDFLIKASLEYVIEHYLHMKEEWNKVHGISLFSIFSMEEADLVGKKDRDIACYMRMIWDRDHSYCTALDFLEEDWMEYGAEKFQSPDDFRDAVDIEYTEERLDLLADFSEHVSNTYGQIWISYDGEDLFE